LVQWYLSGLKVPHRQVCLRALDLHTKHTLDFEDCLALAHMEQQNLTQLYSYDRGFDHIAGITRLEPETSMIESSHHEPV
jgi:predicted nucleic acid-binding protein